MCGIRVGREARIWSLIRMRIEILCTCGWISSNYRRFGILDFGNWSFWLKHFGVKESHLLGSRPNTKGPDVYYYHYHESGVR